MLLRLAVFGLIALGLCGFGTVAVLALRPAPMAPVAAQAEPDRPAPKHLVIAAAAALRAGTLLKPDDLIATELTAVPQGAQEESAAARAGLAGAMLRRSLGSNEAILNVDVMRPGDHGFLAAVLAPGLRAASVGVDAVSGSAGLIWPGDRVDVILTQTLEDQTLPAGRRVAAETVLADVRVIAIDQLLARGVAPADNTATAGRTVTLEVTAADAERIAVATRLGRLSLSVRAADEPALTASRSAVLTTWGGDVSPALGKPSPAKTAGATLRLFQGNADGKEFRF